MSQNDESGREPAPLVVLIDDDGATEHTLASPSLDTESWDPLRLDDDDFRHAIFDADVVLVDQQLYVGAQPNPPLPADGLSLLAVLQRFVAREVPNRLISFALYSGALADISTLPGETRTHVIARLNGFEWAFGKGEESDVKDVISAVASLGVATRRVRTHFDSASAPRDRLQLITELLDLPTAEWAINGRGQLLACHPPISEVLTDTSGAAFLRWLLHRIIPYPTFLHDGPQVAARLGLPVDQVDEMLDGELGRLFEPARYTGVLHDFNGRRYWRAGVEAVLSDLASGDETDSGVLRQALARRVPESLDFVEHPRPVLALDRDYAPLNLPVDPSTTVRVQPDDWPAYAEPARVLVELAVADPDVRALVVAADRRRLNEALAVEDL